jgi:hypothetical protein
VKAHKNHTKDFEDLTYAEQARSINATMAYLTKAIKAHLKKAENVRRTKEVVKQKCMKQAERLLDRIKSI